MNILKRPFTRHLLRENISYIIIILLMLLMTLLLTPYTLGVITLSQNRIKKIETDLVKLRSRKSDLDIIFSQSNIDINQEVRILNNLIPDIENYFSIVTALEEIAKRSDFNISSYNIPFKTTESDQLTIGISGTGDQQSFINFLNNYNFGGGRLITIDKVEFKQGVTSSFSFSLNFYHKDTRSQPIEDLDYKKSVDRLIKLKEKINFVLKESPAQDIESEDLNYPIKSNPF